MQLLFTVLSRASISVVYHPTAAAIGVTSGGRRTNRSLLIFQYEMQLINRQSRSALTLYAMLINLLGGRGPCLVSWPIWGPAWASPRLSRSRSRQLDCLGFAPSRREMISSTRSGQSCSPR